MEVWVIITRDWETGEVLEVEILDCPPKWNLDEHNQICYNGNVNGGDSVQWIRSTV